jgi:K+-sensing histidine kinase KdpD
VTSEALDAARRDWPKTEFDADLAACTVNGSADRLRVAVRNLLDNAAKFGPPEGPVQVRLAGGELTVRDHGDGIAPDDLPFVFDRFYRALSSRGAPGAGLGLAVVREIALGHGGEVTAEPARGGGTVIRLTVPTCEVAERLVSVEGVDAVGPGGFEEADEPGDQGVSGRGEAVPSGAGRDLAVEVGDLGAPGVHQVLQHGR